MAVFDFLKKPAKVPKPAVAATTPVDYVRTMRSQGYADQQIVEALRAQKYPESAINDAMKQSQIKTPGPEPSTPALLQDAPKLEKGDANQGQFEEIAEAIVQEKWEEIKASVEKRKEWEDETAQDLVKLKRQVKDLKADLENLHKAIVSKISDYDQNLLSVGTEIKAMEKVFQKILPDLTKSVGELSRITTGMKKS
ncbi:MAG: hypothetical protein ACE5FT_03160 [Candidatus Nanoarchaeia archaeon]